MLQVRFAALAATSLMLLGCASAEHRVKSDPLEPMNRTVYRFNDAVDRAALKPAAKAYVKYTPGWVRTGIGNFFTNLSGPTTILNQLLQGKFVPAGQDTLRFLINTTLGWGGVLDVASGASLPQHNEDSGQTLGRWGVPAGPYLVLPLLGPASLRDAPARIADDFSRPLHWYGSGEARWGSFALNALDTRARFLPLEDSLKQAYDPYAFIRNAYLQQRQFQVYDGNPPEEPIEDESSGDAEPVEPDPPN
jgi:phospholipid-binding lipoprotein MlaA